ILVSGAVVSVGVPVGIFGVVAVAVVVVSGSTVSVVVGVAISIVTVVAAMPVVSGGGVVCFDAVGEGGGVGGLAGVGGDGEGLCRYGGWFAAGHGDVACVGGCSSAIGVGCGDRQSSPLEFFAFGVGGFI